MRYPQKGKPSEANLAGRGALVQISDVAGITALAFLRVELHRAGTRLDAETHGEVTRVELEKDGAPRITTRGEKKAVKEEVRAK